MSILGIDLGATKLATAVFTEDGSMIGEETVMIEKRAGAEVGALITHEITKALEEQKAVGDEIRSIGICVPGISYQKRGIVWAPNLVGWENYPLLDEIRAVSGDIPVAIDSDRACSILGEVWAGTAQGCRHSIFIVVGTGIGAGIMVDGKILRGSHDIAGAIGWMALERPYRNTFDNSGNFETRASGDGMAKLAREILSHTPDYRGLLSGKPPEELTAYDIFDAYEEGDRIATEVIRYCIELWGMAVANLVSLFNPEKIIFGGGVFGPAIRFLPDIYAEAKKWAQPISIKQVIIEPTSLGNHAPLFGAGLLAIQTLGEK